MAKDNRLNSGSAYAAGECWADAPKTRLTICIAIQHPSTGRIASQADKIMPLAPGAKGKFGVRNAMGRSGGGFGTPLNLRGGDIAGNANTSMLPMLQDMVRSEVDRSQGETIKHIQRNFGSIQNSHNSRYAG
jgi:hypothetical protein